MEGTRRLNAPHPSSDWQFHAKNKEGNSVEDRRESKECGTHPPGRIQNMEPGTL